MAKKKAAATQQPEAPSEDGARTFIAARLRQLGWTNADLARESGLAASVVHRYLGGTDVTSSTLMRMFGALDIGLVVIKINEA